MTLIDGDELMVISGIGEWARRVRELRVQDGWWIYSGNTFQQISEDDPRQAAALKELLGVDPRTIKTHQYALVRTQQDRDAAFRWLQLNSIRKKKISVKDKLLEYFRANVGQPVTGEELRYLANNKREWTRRSRELRTENGWPVMTMQQGRTDLPIGSYVLEEDRQTYEHDRKIPDAVRVEVLERDQFACRVCGWTRDKAHKDDPRRLLELHHIEEHVKGGSNKAPNLLTLCNVHHDDFHAGRLDLTPNLPQ
ncbi:HNH endonuclease [Parerythrobacter lacustris]|uniref:HNH endonuclease n=1 Tax=Parerythrobacter lacustris TaxID=2969984 RepID=A0ABT1XUB8_9SPHN|nr:HNH endonuclease [Parerythrobacter lacustris]MCR2835254.1 HNH endonuclease [Parerythrobacter lacustris]